MSFKGHGGCSCGSIRRMRSRRASSAPLLNTISPPSVGVDNTAGLTVERDGKQRRVRLRVIDLRA